MSSNALSLTAGTSSATPRCELADLFRLYGESYLQEHPLPQSHLRVMHDIEVCRTAELGGHEERCLSCGYQGFVFNSCRNRHCPKCQSLAKSQWLENRKAELLPVPYFHNVFTLPHDLNPVVLGNKRLLLNMLFRAASHTLLQFGHNNLGGQLAFTMVLHTWDQTLRAHFHVHCIIPAGALPRTRDYWIDVDPRFLFPVKALSRVFRGKFLAALREAHRQGKLHFDGLPPDLSTPEGFARLLRDLSDKEWVVYSKPPFGGPEQVLDYLGRYTHRVAISNHRILDIQNHRVRFLYRNRRQSNRLQIMALDAHEFIRRFLLHVLPSGFMRIRHYGFLANRAKREALPQCRRLLGQPPDPPPPPEKTTAEWILELIGRDITRCPNCGSSSLHRIPLAPQDPPPPKAPNPSTDLDSS